MMNATTELRHRGTLNTKSTLRECSLPVNPFVHNIKLGTFEKLKTCLLTALLLPVRAISVCFCLLVAYVLACIGTIGLRPEDLIQKPMKGWRRQLRSVICWWMCKMFVNMGFYRVTIKGIRASEKEAPILALAPHSSFFDAFPVVLLTAPSLVVKQEVQHVPFFARLINYTQPVYVWREDPNSRQNTIKEIKRRVTSGDNWQQILIFPEGTCTNRSGLITFKPGAFYPGVPVQPVCIRYPNKLDTVSWTWQGPGALKLLWLTLTQFCTHCELEFLPVYNPSEEEKLNPKLFAKNVRDIMAKALDVPVVDYSYEDCRLMNKASKLGLPPTVGLIEVSNIREEFRLDTKVLEDDFMEKFAKFANRSTGLATLKHFASYLHLPSDHPKVVELFFLYDLERRGSISFKSYVRGRCTLLRSINNSNRSYINWENVKSALNLSTNNIESIWKFVRDLKSDANENDVLDHLFATIPEWNWIISNLCNQLVP